MYLKCHKFGVDLRTIDGFFVAGRPNDGDTVPVSRAAIDHIPMADRRDQPCEDIGETGDLLGIDLYYGKAAPDGDFYSDRRMDIEKFAFSISRETMYRYLVELTEAFPERTLPKKRVPA